MNFKYNIGETVFHRLKLERPDGKDVQTPVLIIERLVIQCSGGTQLFYQCRLGVTSFGPITFEPTKLYSFAECELER
jgi:hypothetical protein